MNAVKQKNWYYYDGQIQVGPITQAEIMEKVKKGVLTNEDYVFCEGFEDWKFVKDVKLLNLPTIPLIKGNQKPEIKAQKQKRSARVKIQDAVLVHDNQQLIPGVLKNISATGLFFETQIVTVKPLAEIKLIFKDKSSLGKPIHFKGRIVHENSSSSLGCGYGVQLFDMDQIKKECLLSYVSKKRKSQMHAV